MDPVTQGTLGAAAALALVARRAPFRWSVTACMGALGGMAPDLDVLIRSADDPLLNILYHRHFTHSLLFIPIGGAVATLPWLALARYRQHAWWAFAATTGGLATHGLLDAFTTYGTLLFWPFSHHRVSWHVISVIDPLFTFPLLLAVGITIRRRAYRAVIAGCAYGAFYLLLCLAQQQRAVQAQASIAERRGHAVERAVVLPSFANNVTWRSLYESDGMTYVDKVRVTWTGRTCVTSGATVPVVPAPDLARLAPTVARGERLLRWFASGWVAYAPEDPTVLGDLRYSFRTTEVAPIWGIRRVPAEASPEAATGIDWVNRTSSRSIGWNMVRDLLFEDGPNAWCG